MATAPLPELLDCVVPPEWAAALAGASSTGHLQAALARPDLWIEFQLLEKLLYKNANQHRGAQHYQRLQEVRRLLRLLQALQLDRQVAALHAALGAAQQRGALPTGSMPMAYGGDQRRVPSHQAAAGVLRSLVAACRLIEQLAPAIQRASLQLLAQLAHSFFMPICLTSLATLARVQVLSGQLMLDAVRAYNTLAEVAALLPLSTAAGVASAAVAGNPTDTACDAGGGSQPQFTAFGGKLPQLLRAHWRQGLAQLELVSCAPSDSLAEQAAAACTRYAVHVVQAGPAAHAASAVVLEEVAAGAPRQQRQQGSQAAAAAPVLAVLEDRGVPISREAFAAAAVSAEPSTAAAASAAHPAAAAHAAPAAPAAAITPNEAPAPVLLLGVVEDCDAPEEDASGTVASLMEGEARGHLYRRATAVLAPLGTRPLKQQKTGGLALPSPRPLAAAVGATAAAPMPAAAAAVTAAKAAQQQQQQAPPGTTAVAVARPVAVPAPLAASAPPKPAFLSVATAAAPAAPKPAFLSVATPAPQPSAAAPQPNTTASSTAPLATQAAAASASDATAKQQPVGQPVAARTAQPASLSGAARKRKRAAAAAAAAAAEQQQQDEAAGPKSWQDWLQPLAGTAASAGAAPGTQQAQQQQQQGSRRAWK